MPTRPILPCLLLCLGPASSARADEPAAPAAKVFVGYVYGPTRSVDFRGFTHLCHAFVTADGDGRLRPSKQVPDAEFVLNAHAAGVKVLVSLGGWGWDRQFAAIVADREAEDRYVRAVLDLVGSSDYDGIDLDWEYPDTAAEVVGFERLARRFRAELDAIGREKKRPMLQTMAASSNPGTLRWLDRAFLLEAMDWINVMTYDYAGDWSDRAGHNAPLVAPAGQPGPARSVEATMLHLLDERQIPPDRLALGIPLYGRGFAVAEPYAPTKGVPKAKIPGGGNWNNLRLLEAEKGWMRRWDDAIQAPWLRSPDGSTIVGYDDAESVALKAGWAADRGLRGVFFWEVHADRMPDGSHPLQEAALGRLRRGPAAGPGAARGR